MRQDNQQKMTVLAIALFIFATVTGCQGGGFEKTATTVRVLLLKDAGGKVTGKIAMYVKFGALSRGDLQGHVGWFSPDDEIPAPAAADKFCPVNVKTSAQPIRIQLSPETQDAGMVLELRTDSEGHFGGVAKRKSDAGEHVTESVSEKL